jgi:O-antigen/teichoic acid export membrane protein
VITFGPSFVRFWSGLDALFDRPTALALLAGAVLAAPSMAIGSYLVYSGSAKPNALALSFQLATGLLFCAALAPALGAVGTGIGLALGEGIGQTAILPMLAAGSLHDLDYFRYLRRCLAVIAFSAGWCASLSSAVTFLFDVTAGSGFVCASAVWIVLAPFPLAAAAFRSHRAKSSGPVAAGPVAAH